MLSAMPPPTEGRDIFSQYLLMHTMVPDPQWVVDINAVFFSSIFLISHHAFNPLYFSPLYRVTDSIDLV